MKTPKNQFLKYLTVGLPLILMILFFLMYLNSISKMNEMREENKIMVENHNKQIALFNADRDNLRRLLQIKKNDDPNNISLYHADISQLKRKGLSDPVQDIISDMKKHPELIPYSGVLGGTMGFYESESFVLNNRWVFAYFDDGHVIGHLLLQYEVTEDGKINWKRIAATLP